MATMTIATPSRSDEGIYTTLNAWNSWMSDRGGKDGIRRSAAGQKSLQTRRHLMQGSEVVPCVGTTVLDLLRLFCDWVTSPIPDQQPLCLDFPTYGS